MENITIIEFSIIFTEILQRPKKKNIIFEEINYKIPQYNVYVKDLRSNLYYRNENNKFYLKPPSPGAIEVRMQPNMT